MVTIIFSLILPGVSLGPGKDPAPSFEKHIAPILQNRCLKCHGGTRPRGDLDLTTRAGMLAGGTHGPVLAPGQSSDSTLFLHVRDQKMPPRTPLPDAEVDLLRRWIDAGAAWQGPALTAPRSEARRADANWWSLRPVRRPALPGVRQAGWVRTPLDAFLLARLEVEGLTPAPEADRPTLLRRLTLDLTGLLPSPEEAEAFLRDDSPGAYEKVVEHLLASPHYGERWGRHWLDVIRFGESHGYEMNQRRANAWTYRDYVIRALNEDRPYARFVREQLAGDVVGRGDPVTEAATGFLVAGPHDQVGNATLEGKLQQRVDDLFDMVSTTGTTFLGLTVGCARCHDHKFDPITQQDFYGMQAVFAGVEHNDRPLTSPDEPQRRRDLAALRTELADIDLQIDRRQPLAGVPGTTPGRPPVQARRNVERFPPTEARQIRFVVNATVDGTEPCLDELEVYGIQDEADNLALASKGAKPSASSVYPDSPLHRIAHLNDARVGNSHSWISNERGKGWAQVELPQAVVIDRLVWGRDREGAYADRLARDYRIDVSTDGHTWRTLCGSWDRLPPGSAPAGNPDATLQTWLDRRRQIEKRIAELDRPLLGYAGTFRLPDPTHVLRRGDPMQKGEEVSPSALQAVGPRLGWKPGGSEADRRLALADWIAHPDNPLPDRVLVNRVWHWHFGQGLVRTPSDFGFNGDRPSHPELLDWLASEFRAAGGRLKPLHRQIVLSATYRQSGRDDTRARAVDAGNRLCWRFAPRRLEAEEIRDTMLQVSGALDPRMGGPGYHLWDYSGYVIVYKPKAELGREEFRRMVYQFKPRLQQDGTFGAFDCPDATQSAPRRQSSTTALQALNLLNDPFVLDQCRLFAGRVSREAGPDTPAQVRAAFRLAFGRDPTGTEAAAAAPFVQEHGLPALGRALFNANEFLYVH